MLRRQTYRRASNDDPRYDAKHVNWTALKAA